MTGSQTLDDELKRLVSTGAEASVADLNARLRVIWPQLRAPQRSHTGSVLVTLFRRAGYVSDASSPPTEAMTVYRGELVRAGDPGISWTAEFQTARRYAQGYATLGDTRVMRASAPPTAILAKFQPDAEVVVVPELRTKVECLGYIQHTVSTQHSKPCAMVAPRAGPDRPR